MSRNTTANCGSTMVSSTHVITIKRLPVSTGSVWQTGFPAGHHCVDKVALIATPTAPRPVGGTTPPSPPLNNTSPKADTAPMGHSTDALVAGTKRPCMEAPLDSTTTSGAHMVNSTTGSLPHVDASHDNAPAVHGRVAARAHVAFATAAAVGDGLPAGCSAALNPKSTACPGSHVWERVASPGPDVDSLWFDALAHAGMAAAGAHAT